jgi:hypothetical protein
MPLKEQIAARQAFEPQRFVCVERADKERPAGIGFYPWEGLPVIFPWIRFDGGFYEGEPDNPDLVLVFAGNRIVVQGTGLLTLAEDIREQHITALHATPLNHSAEFVRDKLCITGFSFFNFAGY